jgi:flagellar assembly protein FliH
MATTTHTVQFTQPLVGAKVNVLPPLGVQARKLLFEREEESFEKGRQSAESSFSQQLVSQRNEMVELQNGVLNSVRAVIPQVIRETEQMLIDLAVATAERLVSGMPVNREMVEATIREALAQVEDGSQVRVMLHADDLALLNKGGSELLDSDETGGSLVVEISGEVTRGGCVLRTRFGDIDARRETKLEQVKQALTE